MPLRRASTCAWCGGPVAVVQSLHLEEDGLRPGRELDLHTALRSFRCVSLGRSDQSPWLCVASYAQSHPTSSVWRVTGCTDCRSPAFPS
jgi:hypothetical protein